MRGGVCGGKGADPTSALSLPAAEKCSVTALRAVSPTCFAAQREERAALPPPPPRPAPPRSPADTHPTGENQAGRATHAPAAALRPSLRRPGEPEPALSLTTTLSPPRGPPPLLKASPLPHPASLPSGPQTRSRLPPRPPRPPRPPGAGQKEPTGYGLPSRGAIGPLPPQPALTGKRLPPRPIQLLHDSRPPPPRTNPAPGARRSLLGAGAGPIRQGRGRPPATRSGGWGRDYAAAQGRPRRGRRRAARGRARAPPAAPRTPL